MKRSFIDDPLSYSPQGRAIVQSLRTMTQLATDNGEKWRRDPVTGERKEQHVGTQMMLIVGEVNEAHEALRRTGFEGPDKYLPHRPAVEVEMADAVLRILDFCGHAGLDLPGAIWEKHVFNTTRPDHSDAARIAPGGKKF